MESDDPVISFNANIALVYRITLSTFWQHRTNASIEKQIVSNEDVPLMKMLKAIELHYVHLLHYNTTVLWH